MQARHAVAERVEPTVLRRLPGIAAAADDQEVAAAHREPWAASAASRSATVIAALPSR